MFRVRNGLSATSMEDEIVRDEKGRIVKGHLNRGGLNPRQLRLKRQIEALTPIAINRLGQLAQSANETVALGAVKEILDRNLGRAKQQVAVDVSVEHTHVMHLEALKRLADRARGTGSGYIDAQPVERIEHSTLSPEGWTENAGVSEAVEAAVAAASGAEPPGPGDHPAGGAFTPTPAPATRKKATRRPKNEAPE